MSYEQGTPVTIDAGWETEVTDLTLTIRAPDETVIEKTFADVVQDTPTTFHFNVVADQPGDWYYIWQPIAPGLGPIESSFSVDANRALQDGVSSLADVRVMIPRVRRALEGPGSTGPLADSAVLTDDQVTALIADAIADVILYSGSAFGHELVVTSRDAHYMAPDAWEVDPEFSQPEQSVIVAQAALGYFFHQLKDLKVSEEISDEASTWKYQLSSTLIRDQMKMLQDARDRALTAVELAASVGLDVYISYLEERDSIASRLIEPWVQPWSGGGYAQDVRFGGY